MPLLPARLRALWTSANRVRYRLRALFLVARARSPRRHQAIRIRHIKRIQQAFNLIRILLLRRRRSGPSEVESAHGASAFFVRGGALFRLFSQVNFVEIFLVFHNFDLQRIGFVRVQRSVQKLFLHLFVVLGV